jgi:hypothetical protein
VSRVDTAIRAAAGITVVGLAGIAGAISYSHMAELAKEHGEHSWRAHMFPLSVDLIEIVASLVLLADKRARRRSGYLPWAALITGTAASFAANIAVGGSDWIGRAVSGWPAFAFLIAVKLLFGLLDHPSVVPTADAEAEPVRVPALVPEVQWGTVPPVPDGLGGPDPTLGDGRDARDDHRSDPDDVRDGQGVTEPAEDSAPTQLSVLPSTLDVSALLPAARAARAKLISAGQSVSRDGLARQLRADGHAASNTRISAVLKALAAAEASDEAAA